MSEPLTNKLYKAFSEALEDEDESSPVYQELSEIDSRYGESEFIARGGMKVVDRVYDKVTQRFIAMAQLYDEAPKELYDPFIREARLTALLKHPNIIPIYNIGIDKSGLPYFTMELKRYMSNGKYLVSNYEQKMKPLFYRDFCNF